MSEMPWTLWHFDGTLLRPKAPFDLSMVADRYKPGTQLRAKFAQPRSLPHHRLYWAILAEVVAATGQWPSVDDLHEAVKIELRMLRGIVLLNGEVRFLTASIAFNEMDQGQFNLFFDNAMATISEHTGIDMQGLIAAAKEKIGPEEGIAA